MAHLDDFDADLDAASEEASRGRDPADAAGFIERGRVIDRLELHLHELTGEIGRGELGAERARRLAHRAEGLRDRLQRLNDSAAERFRDRIAAASLSSAELMATLRQYVGGARSGTRDHVQYDDLDAFIASVLCSDRGLDERAVEPHPDMVGYQPTPARLVLDLIGELLPTERDVFVDLGSGLGTVPVLVALLTAARAIGIEWNPACCAHARAVAGGLSLSTVRFVEQDAREADFSTGTIFYMFTPFKGAMLHDVLERLAAEARSRAIRLCAHGPLLREAIAEFHEFSRDDGSGSDAFVAIFRSTKAG